VAIYIHNAVASSKSEHVEILLEKGLLIAVNNVIREEYSLEATLFGLRALNNILKAA
jgi:hypothetical protein